jgi:hypothetical protein
MAGFCEVSDELERDTNVTEVTKSGKITGANSKKKVF